MTSTVPEPDQPHTQAKRDSEALLAALISFSRDAIVSTSPQGVIQTWNDGAQRLLGWSARDAMGQPMLALVTDMANEKGRELMARAMKAEPFQMELELLDHQGRRVEVSVGAAPVRDRQDQIIALSFIIRDLRRRHLARRTEAVQLRTCNTWARTVRKSYATAVATHPRVLQHMQAPLRRGPRESTRSTPRRF